MRLCQGGRQRPPGIAGLRVAMKEETRMTDQSKPYTPLTTDNSALVLVDHQVGLMTGVRDYETGELKHNVVALAKAAKVLRIPTVVTTTDRKSTRLNSSHGYISYAVFCLKKKTGRMRRVTRARPVITTNTRYNP